MNGDGAVWEFGRPIMPIIATHHREAFGEALRANWTLDRSAMSAVDAVRPLAAIAIVLAAGLATGHPAPGAIAAGGALSVGFGSFHRLRSNRAAPMLLATIGVTLATGLGSFAGHSALAFVGFAAMAAYACGLFAALSYGMWWVVLQCAVFALIASSRPVDPGIVLQRVSYVFAGCALQAVLMIAFFSLDRPKEKSDGAPPSARAMIAEGIRVLRANTSPRTETGREALRLAIAVGLAAFLSRIISFQNGYWLPMTTLIVLRTDVRLTWRYGLGRMAGTVIGAGLTTAITVALHPGPATLAMLVLVSAGLCYTLLKANYGLYAVCITSYVVFLSAMVGLPEYTVAYARVVYTLLGGALALIAHGVASGPAPVENENVSG